MNKIYTLKDYNAKGYSRYILAVNKAVKEMENIPAMCHYIFNKSTGYVVVCNDKPMYFSSKEKANQYLVKIESEIK